ncbi:phosphatase-like protein [Niveomyces insectorum RCEF 264]|uniref:Very-long-chain (3R)-3-hydroxyacyl-CoA dehydratase n=1 Tax=Niveomyces insectorum RCEF 264 TaxID=1081102 RepID=A0A167Y9A9_9HYPO|nr:phosphatase-like protein [Niveomyces insectorum RCEF 264]
MAPKAAPPASAAAAPAGRASALYLTLYNFASALLWTVVLGRTVFDASVVALVAASSGVAPLAWVSPTTTTFVRWTQTLALLEVVHALFGIVRAPLVTTAMQVASRLLLVWPVLFLRPAATTISPFYASMLLAWSLTEVIRYSYFVVSLARGGAAARPRPPPAWFTRLRYSTFLVLYPVGIASEVRLVYLAARTTPVVFRSDAVAAYLPPAAYTTALHVLLATYVPGSYILYTYMLAQRRKVLRRLDAAAGKKTE